MIARGIPSSSDIYLEINGKKVAVVQSYSAQSSKTSSVVEAFGETEPVATITGTVQHVLELTRIYATDEAIADGLRFYDLEDFNPPGRRRWPLAADGPCACCGPRRCWRPAGRRRAWPRRAGSGRCAATPASWPGPWCGGGSRCMAAARRCWRR